MYDYAKAFLLALWGQESLVSQILAGYWLRCWNLPGSLLGLLFAIEADSDSHDSASLIHKIKAPGKLLLVCERSSRKEQDLSPSLRTRSYKYPRHERNRNPAAAYEKGEIAWLSIAGEPGSFKVTIHGEGVWNGAIHQWVYPVRQTDGKLYDNGNLVAEECLNQCQK